ncbi:MAG: hypothetical protein GY869_21105, partial [Planctomycetes bacterium]|nr:hypothetical protein [Planctomycetota bacterium]
MSQSHKQTMNFLLLTIFLCLPAATAWGDIDIGLRLFDGQKIVKIACEPKGTVTSPLRIAKDGTIYGIVLVDPGAPTASGIIIPTPSGPKALAKLP